jgi:hypothetical protein
MERKVERSIRQQASIRVEQHQGLARSAIEGFPLFFLEERTGTDVGYRANIETFIIADSSNSLQ